MFANDGEMRGMMDGETTWKIIGRLESTQWNKIIAIWMWVKMEDLGGHRC